ncbi:unnamed protein product [Rotaria sp. Silwood1]|nr:unnamed protein product [Rotaria sp. Silwood1]
MPGALISWQGAIANRIAINAGNETSDEESESESEKESLSDDEDEKNIANHTHVIDFYFRTLDYCIKNENEKIGAAALQQIALHLSDDISDQKQYQRLLRLLPSNLSSATIPEIHKPILTTIEIFRSRKQTTNQDMQSNYTLIFFNCHYQYL